jgi:2-polyprenyl-3-methyl-5-hydroxy-6-metoxy-1,4-benzoquinol methylase
VVAHRQYGGSANQEGVVAVAETAVARHDRMVNAERDQAERLRTDQGGEPDLWKPHARRFGLAREGEHVAVGPLASLAEPASRVIDIGAGGGRITIPLARRVRDMVAVEPSPAMREVLAAEAEASGVTNLEIVPSSWDEAEVAPADLVYAANVTYGILDIEPFLRKLDAKAMRAGALVAFADPPQHIVAPFWRAVYGEERLRLPCRAELLAVLRELGADPRTIDLPPQEPRPLGTPAEAFEELRRRLFIGRGHPLESRLSDAIERLTVERDGLLWSTDARSNERSVIWWDAGQMR